MNATGRAIGAAVLSGLVLVSSSAPAVAKDRKSRKGAPKAHKDVRKPAVARHVRPAPRPSRPVVVAPRRPGTITVGRRDGKFRLSIGVGQTTRRQWVSGRFETRVEQVCVEPGHYESHTQTVEVSPAHFEVRPAEPVEEILYDSHGNAHKVVVDSGRTEKVWVPARYETRQVKVWVPPRYETRTTRIWVPGRWVITPIHRPARLGLNLGALLRF